MSTDYYEKIDYHLAELKALYEGLVHDEPNFGVYHTAELALIAIDLETINCWKNVKGRIIKIISKVEKY